MYGMGILKGLGITLKHFVVSYKDDLVWLGKGGRYHNDEAFLQRQSLKGEGVVTVYYPEEKIQEMRRLSKGAKVIATVVSKNDKYADLKVSELNGVSVVISSAEIAVTKKNRFAKAITLFFWQVPSGLEYKISILITPLKLCSNSSQVRLSLDKSRKNFSDYFLGAKLERIAVLEGHDEIGRPVRTRVAF